MLELFMIVRVSFWLVGAGRMPRMCAATPTLKLSTFSPKSGHFRWKRHFCEIISVDTHSTALFAPITILKNSKYFIQKKSISLSFAKCHFFSRILRKFCQKQTFSSSTPANKRLYF